MLDAYSDRNAEAAEAVWRQDGEIDEIYNSLFRELLTYMMEDPRTIGLCTHLLFIAKNIERSGDHATNIAEVVYHMVRGDHLATDRPKADTTSETTRALRAQSMSLKPTVLVAEDEGALVTLLRYNLEREGYRVLEAQDGEEALLVAAEEKPDLVLLDWMLPQLSGIEVCRRLRGRQETRNVPIIMLTARGEETDRIRGLDTGADDYLTKPFSMTELLARLRAVMRRIRPSLRRRHRSPSATSRWTAPPIACAAPARKFISARPSTSCSII